MNKYYSLNWKHEIELASAFYAVEDQVACDLIPQLDGKNLLPLNFELRRVKEGKHGLVVDNNLTTLKEIWLDYQPNSFAWPLMSERFKSVIENNLTGKEQVDWITCEVKHGSEERRYFILRFNKKLDVLDMQKTMFFQNTDQIIKPVFSASKIMEYSIFSKPLSHYLWKITPDLYVSETLRQAIWKAKLSGVIFEKATVI